MKTRIFEAPVVTVFVSKCGVGEGVDGGWMPLPTHPQQYCDPVSLVPPSILGVVRRLFPPLHDSDCVRALPSSRLHQNLHRGKV